MAAFEQRTFRHGTDDAMAAPPPPDGEVMGALWLARVIWRGLRY